MALDIVAESYQFPRYGTYTETQWIPADERKPGESANREVKHKVVVHSIQMEYVASNDVRSIEGYPVAVIEWLYGQKAGYLGSVPVGRIRMGIG